jgi:hypothetical protein
MLSFFRGYGFEVFPGGALRAFFTVLFLFLMACGGPGKPDESLVSFFNAVKAGRGERAVSHLAPEAVEALALGMDIEAMRASPDSSAALLASYGVSVTPDELRTLSPETLLSRLAASPLLSAMMRDATLTTGAVTIDGPRAYVDVTVVFTGDTHSGVVEMVLDDNQWKVGSEGLRFAL